MINRMLLYDFFYKSETIEMSLVNCRVQHIRPKYNNLKEWMEDENNIYIGRGCIVFIDGERFPKVGSKFCNPYKIGQDGTRDEVIEKYKIYMEDRLNKSPELVKQLLKLKGKNLGCWCKPDKCHGDVLLELINIY